MTNSAASARTAKLSYTSLGSWRFSRGRRLYAAALEGSVPYDEPDYRSSKAAFLIGNEGNGLTDEAIAAADQAIRIPMFGQVESLNAAIAASILMYEALRQNNS